MLDIISEDPSRQWTYRDLAMSMRSNELVSSAQPRYSAATAYRDWLVVLNELKERRGEMASMYIDSQLNIADDLMEGLMDQWDAIDAIDLYEIEDPAERVMMSLKLIAAKKDIVIAIDRVMARQQTLVPIAIPKRVEVDNRHVSMNLDYFQEQRRKALDSGGID